MAGRNQENVAVRKSAQIFKANRTMFGWIVGASVIVGASLVVSYFMVKTIVFQEEVIGEKNKTVNVLKSNNANIEGLSEKIRALDADDNLLRLRLSDEDKAIQVILDALPAENNPLALGASLQNVLLKDIEIESLNVGDESFVEDGSAGDGSIGFSFSAKGSEAVLAEILQRLERSIRTIDVTSVNVQMSSGSGTMSVQGRAFYEPAAEIKLVKKKVEP